MYYIQLVYSAVQSFKTVVKFIFFLIVDKMSELSSVDVQLQQCEECKKEGYTVIGKLSFCANCDLGRYWTTRSVFKNYSSVIIRGKFEGTLNVAVRRIHKGRGETKIITAVESETLIVVVHPNIVRYYTTEQDEYFWYVNVNNDQENNYKYVTKSLNTHQVHWNGIVCRNFE